MRTRYFRFVRHDLPDRVEVVDRSEVVGRVPVDRMTGVVRSDGSCKPNLPDHKEVGGLRLMPENGRADEVVVDDLSDLSAVYIAEKKRLSVTHIEDRRLAKVQLD